VAGLDRKRKGFFFGLYLGLSVKLVAPAGIGSQASLFEIVFAGLALTTPPTDCGVRFQA